MASDQKCVRNDLFTDRHVWAADCWLCRQMTVQFCVQDHLKLVEELPEQKVNHLADLVEHLISSSSLSLAVFKVDSYLSFFSSVGWANSITGQKLSVCMCLCVCLCVNQGGTEITTVCRLVILCTQIYWWTPITGGKLDQFIGFMGYRKCLHSCAASWGTQPHGLLVIDCTSYRHGLGSPPGCSEQSL